MEYPELVMNKREDLNLGIITYTLWDTTNQCLLDEWIAEGFQDFEEFKQDLRILGFDV